ncbi:MAG: universal stress protein, partial [Bacteroidia bacterium]|nr:universal stress protein [Bacteroidia bacterium]
MTEQIAPFSKIALAVAFSPRCESLLAETKMLQEKFACELLFIHVGSKTLQEEQYLKHLLHRFELDQPKNKTIWREGDPVDTILEICQEEQIDLLVAGALEKESIINYVFGGVSRQLSRKIKCSMLLLTEPNIHPKGFNYLVVEGTDHPKTENTIATAVQIAKLYKSKHVDIIQENDLTKIALIRSEELKEHEAGERMKEILSEEDEKLEEILRCSNCGNLAIHTERIEGKPGYVISKYAREKEADLLVINSPDKPLNLLDRVFPHDMEYALANLPCNLLIVHPK